MKRRLLFTLRALRYKNFRLFFAGQAVSLIGTWMTNTASSWLVYRLTGSAFLLGLVGFASQFPAFLLAPAAGVYVDRWNKHKILIACQALSMLQSLALAGFTLTGHITYPLIIVLSCVQGLVNAFEIPCRQSFVVSMVDDKEAIGNAIALNSSMFNFARILGPTLAGIVIAASSEGWCYLIDGVSYVAVIGSLLMLKPQGHMPPLRAAEGALKQLRDGWTYAFRSNLIRSVIILLALVSLVGVPYNVLVPVVAAQILRGGPHTLGFLMASAGCGAMLGALWLAARRGEGGLERAIRNASIIFGCGLIGFALSRALWLSMASLVVTGIGFMVQIASSNTLLQTVVEDDKRGRVMSIFVMALLGTAPLGALFAGSFGDRFGAPRTLFMAGLACIAGAAWFARRLKSPINLNPALK